MNKNEYKDNYVAVIKALQHALDRYTYSGYTMLYLSKENGLMKLDVSEVDDILKSLAEEQILKIYKNIKMSDFLRFGSEPDVTSELIYPGTQSKRRRMLENHFELIVDKLRFKNVLNTYGSPAFLLSHIPKDKKYKYLLRVATPLVEEYGNEVENFKLAVCFNSKLSKSDYLKNKVTNEKYNNKIENRLKTLKKILLPYGYTIKFNKSMSQLVKL